MSQVEPVAIASFVVAGLTAVIGGYALRRRSSPGAIPFSVLALAVTVWEVGYGLSLLGQGTGSGLLWAEVQWVAVVVIPVAWLVFALEYTGHDRWVTPGTLAVLSIEPIAMVGLIWTTGYHDLLSTAAPAGARTVWGTVAGPALVYHLTYSYVLLFLGTAILIQLIRTTPELYGDTTTALVVGVGVPWGANVAYWLELVPAGFDPTPIGFAVSGVAFGWVLYERRLLEVLPVTPAVAHKELFDELTDGVVTVDAHGRIIDHNRAAGRLLDEEAGGDGSTGEEYAGRRVEEVLPDQVVSVVERATDGGDPQSSEVVLSTGDDRRYFEVDAEPLRRRSERTVGALLTLHDIHDRVLREQRLNVLNRVLRHNVRHQSNLVLANADRIERELTGRPPGDGDVDEMLDRTDALRECADQLDRWGKQAREIEAMLETDDRHQSAVDLVPVVREVVSEFRRSHPDAEITTRLPDTATASVHSSLEDAITELLENAIQHNDDHPHVGVELARTDDGVELAVVDDGPGIPEGERKVLDEEVETDLTHGSGLGLWLVNWAVRASGGEVSFEADRSGGSEVRIDLPRAGQG